jgi:hypothetical protein
MLRFLTDEDFDGRLTRALLARLPALDLVRAEDVALMHTPDPEILAWAADQGRIILTRDRNTMTACARARVDADQSMPGIFAVDQRTPLGRLLNDLEALAAASDTDEWRDQVIFVPL